MPPSESLRDQLSAAFDTVTADESGTDTATEAVGTPAPAESTQASTATEDRAEAGIEPQSDRPGRTAGRQRDEAGRLLPGKAERPEPAAAQQADQPAAVEQPAQRAARPSTWKKDHWPAWDKIAAENPALADYLVQREREFSKGVSTYRTEYERLRPVGEALNEFAPLLQQHGVAPDQWIRSLGNAHRTLVTGSPQEKLVAVASLARDYKIPIEQLFMRGADGQIYWNDQITSQANAQRAQQAPQQQTPDVQKIVRGALAEERARTELERFITEAPTKYPHYQEVKETMAGLLQAGLADTYEGAYKAALRHPNHESIFEAQQEQQRQAEATRVADEKRKAAEAARRKTISVGTSTPTGSSGLNGSGKKGLRDTISEQFDAHVGGRV